MHIVLKVLLSIFYAVCCLSVIFALDNIHRLKESLKDSILIVSFFSMFALIPFLFESEEHGAFAIFKLVCLVFSYVCINYALYPPSGEDNGDIL